MKTKTLDVLVTVRFSVVTISMPRCAWIRNIHWNYACGVSYWCDFVSNGKYTYIYIEHFSTQIYHFDSVVSSTYGKFDYDIQSITDHYTHHSSSNNMKLMFSYIMFDQHKVIRCFICANCARVFSNLTAFIFPMAIQRFVIGVWFAATLAMEFLALQWSFTMPSAT